MNPDWVCLWAKHTITTRLLIANITLHLLCFPPTLPLMFRNQKRSLPSSMKPGKRNCERRRQSAWRGQYWQYWQYWLSVSLFSPICLISSALILSISLPFSVITLCCTYTPLTPFLPLYPLICGCRCQPCYCLSIEPHWCHSLCEEELSSTLYPEPTCVFPSLQGGLACRDGCGNPWRWRHFGGLFS